LRLSKAISLAFFVVVVGVKTRFGTGAVADPRAVAGFGASVRIDFIGLVMMFSFVINRVQIDPGTDRNPECRAENMGHCQKMRRYRQYRSVRQVSPVVSACKPALNLNKLPL